MFNSFSPKYHKFKIEVNKLIEQQNKSKKSNEKPKMQCSTKQQILILYYLGVIKNVDIENTKKAFLLSKLLNRSEQNIRECLTYIDAINIKESEIKTKSNLEDVRKIFETIGMEEKMQLIDKDLEKAEKFL